MGLIKTIDDISVGDLVAMYGPVPRKHPSKHRGVEDAGSFRQWFEEARMRPDEVIVMQPKMPVPPGYPMRVLEVSLPFAACVVIEPGGSESGPAIIDLRSFQLCRVSKEFVAAIQGFKDEGEEDVVEGEFREV